MALVELSQGEISTITLNDPAARNAMGENMALEFKLAIQQLKLDPKVRVVILTGAGDVFSGGGNLTMLEEKTKLSESENERKMLEFYSAFLSIRELKVPTIAAINGHAIGAACCLALACDMRVAVAGSKIGMNFVALGLHPGMGATYFVPRLVGPGKAAELLYTASVLPAEEALALGLVNQVSSMKDFDSTVKSLAMKISKNGPEAIQMLKTSLTEDETISLQKCLEREAKFQAKNYISSEFLEGITAAKEKRTPCF